MWKPLVAVVVLALTLACTQPVAPPVHASVVGDWSFAAHVSYGEVACHDSLTMHLMQRGGQVQGTATEWRVRCADGYADGPLLLGGGRVVLDSVYLTWLSEPTNPNCSSCQAYRLWGTVDSLGMAGELLDPLGVHGTWIATRLP